jgi:hypothetical protein
MARRLYPAARFHVVQDPIRSMPDSPAELVFARDVVMHAMNPREFLGELYEITIHHLVLRLRTKEKGETIYDPVQSCLYAYGNWVPYIVFNTAELISLLGSCKPRPSRILVRRNPVVLGGYNGRFLPKEFYYPETGTAETALLIDKGARGNTGNPVIDIETSPEISDGFFLHEMLRKVARRLRI